MTSSLRELSRLAVALGLMLPRVAALLLTVSETWLLKQLSSTRSNTQLAKVISLPMSDEYVGYSTFREWDGDDLDGTLPNDVIYYAEGFYSRDTDSFVPNLARALQTDGVAGTFGQSQKLAQVADVRTGFCGRLEGEDTLVECEDDGTTASGDRVTSPVAVTFAYVPLP